jgi:amidophosphoribosyltransferase
MSDAKHECGIALVRLLKPLEFTKRNMELLSTEYKNVSPWKSSIIVDGVAVLQTKIRHGARGKIHKSSNVPINPFKMFFAQINDRINQEMAAHPEYADDVALSKSKDPI